MQMCVGANVQIFFNWVNVVEKWDILSAHLHIHASDPVFYLVMISLGGAAGYQFGHKAG